MPPNLLEINEYIYKIKRFKTTGHEESKILREFSLSKHQTFKRLEIANTHR